jgi:3',5'-nucleoside bisphosphate phosphatase
MKRAIPAVFILIVLTSIPLTAQVRDEFRVPDIPGFQTLKMDPHLHTVFSDGLVWPTVRVHEAWREGLDAIAITEHIEYRPFLQDVPGDHNRAYDIARPVADQMGIILIHGSEVTRAMPPGHFNALFLSDANALEQEDWRDALREARDQGAFIFWNHPGWDRQQPDTTLWWEEHTWLLENGMLHGIEVANGWIYAPEAIQWCLEHGLSMIGSSDLHNPSSMDYDLGGGQRRSMTLVFARERSAEGIREALDERRTAVYFKDNIAGPQELLDALFRESLVVESVTRHANRFGVTLYNPTDIPLELSKAAGNEAGLEFFRQVTVPARGYRNINVYMADPSARESIELRLQVDNFIVGPGKGLPVRMQLKPDDDQPGPGQD